MGGKTSFNTIVNAMKIVASARIRVWKIGGFFAQAVSFPPPVLSGSGSLGRQHPAVLSAESLSQLPETLKGIMF